MESIGFTYSSVDKIGINDSSRYPPDEYLHEDDPSRQYRSNYDISYYITLHNRSVTELIKTNHILEVIVLNAQDTPHTKETEGMLTRSLAAKLTAASTSECLFVDFLYEIEPKRVTEALKHPGWGDAMQEELNQFHINKVWTLVQLPRGKIAIGSKWMFRNKKDELGTIIENKAILVAQGFSREDGIDYNETFALISDSASVKTHLTPPNNLGLDLAGKPVNATLYRGMIGSLMYLTASRLDIQFSTCLCTRYQSNPKESHLIAMKRIFMYLKGCNMDRKSTSGACQLLRGKLVCWSAKKYQLVAMSSVEAKCANILWIKSQLIDYDMQYKPIPIFYDNISAIAISNNPALYSRTKYIDIRCHFIKDYILKGDIELHFIPTEY
ncbi:retrovirus-related pol polyprotein from transposon TNT 1-94 [Tanacetum coccineum]